MANAILLIMAALLASGIVVIGWLYLASPERIAPSFGLRPPASDADTRAWLRLKGVRDVASGCVVLALLAVDRRSVGVALLALALIPLGDMLVILFSRGAASKALSIHGVTSVVMLVVGLVLVGAI